MSTLIKLVLGVVLVASLFAAFSGGGKHPSAPSTPPTQMAPPDPVVVAQKAAEKAAQSARTQSAGIVAITIKNSARDPDSLVFESLHTNDGGTVVCAAYRARNGFGGMNKEIMVLANGKTSQTAGVWNKNCTNGGMHDMMWVAKFAQKYKG